MTTVQADKWERRRRLLAGTLAVLSTLALVGGVTQLCTVWCRDGLGQSMTFLNSSH